jgi:orotate phosphoribosyltransferase
MQPFQQQFLTTILERKALLFGDFTLKSGLKSPYFFNLGALCHGADWLLLGQCYADALVYHQLPGQVLFGPAYKGIPLVSVTALMLAHAHQRNYPTAYNRKEAKDHGEGGTLVGAAIANQTVILLDDVLTKGTALSQAKQLIEQQGGTVASVLVALDRQQRENNQTMRTRLSTQWQIPIAAIADMQDVVQYLKQNGEAQQAEVIQAYLQAQ